MSSLILNASLTDSDDSTQQITLYAWITDEEDWAGRFNRLQFFRSTSGPSGPFEEITGSTWSAPRIPSNAGNPPSSPITGKLVNLVGMDLELLINEAELTITFTGSDPLSLTQAANQIAAQSGGLLSSYVDVRGQLVIETTQAGLNAKLEVLESDGATVLSLPVTSVTGKDARLNLVVGQTTYEIRDTFGSRENYYRTRFLNSVTGARGEPSVSSTPRAALGVSAANVIVGYAELTQQSGSVWEGAEVHLYAEGGGPLVEGKLVGGATLVKSADATGRVEFQVVRGQRLTVSVQGTLHVRTITVPTDPAIESFNFFDPTIADDDIFKVSVPDLVVAERRTL